MKISVGMATYNGETYLHEQLQSISNQLRLPDEVIICDDASTDRTREIIRDFAGNAPFPVQIHENEENFGPIQTFERAIELCRGDLVVLCDQDDSWRPEKLQRIEERSLSSPNAGLLFSDAELIDQSGQALNRRLWQYTLNAKSQRQIRTGKAFQLLVQRDVVTGATLAFQRRFREMILPIPTDIPLIHDGWIALIIAAVSDIAMLPEPLINYRLHPGQHLGIEPFKQRPTDTDSSDSSSLKKRSVYYSGEIRKLRTVLQRLTLIGELMDEARQREDLQKRIAYLDELLIHFHVRGSLPEARLSRGPIVLRELLALRYHRYSKGLLSVLKDLSI